MVHSGRLQSLQVVVLVLVRVVPATGAEEPKGRLAAAVAAAASWLLLMRLLRLQLRKRKERVSP